MHKGQIHIGRINSSQLEEDYIEIEITDEKSHIQFCEVKMSLKDFALAITGRGFSDCEFEVRGTDKIGYTREHKTEEVKLLYKDKYNLTEADYNKTLKPFEKDGWEARRQDLKNHHCIVRGKEDTYMVNFSRLVAPDKIAKKV
jgi:hypothetical protein